MNKDVNLNIKMEETKTTRYFQPVITNNTVIIPAKRLQENVSEATESTPIVTDRLSEELVGKIDKVESKSILDEKVEYKNLSVDNIEKQVTYTNLSNLFEEPKMEEPKIEELKIEEIIIEEVKPVENTVENKNSDNIEKQEENKSCDSEEAKEFMMKLEDMAKIFEQNQVKDFDDFEAKEEIENEDSKESVENETDVLEEVKDEENKAYKESALNKDDTKKMDLPFVEESETDSIPQRRQMEDNLSEMKSKLFLLASNAKKPVRICVNKKVFLMGSDYAKMDCVIRNNRYISRCHSKIYYEAGCYFIEDVGSMNGTYINGVKLAEGIKYKLETGDLINLADCKFEVDIKS